MTDYLEPHLVLQLVERAEVLAGRMRELMQPNDPAVRRELDRNARRLLELLDELNALLVAKLRSRGLDPKVYAETLGSIRDDLDRLEPES